MASPEDDAPRERAELERELERLRRERERIRKMQERIERMERFNERLERWHSRIPEYDRWVGVSILPAVVWVIALELFGTRPAIGLAFGTAVIVFFVQRRMQPGRGAIFWLAVLGLLISAGGTIVGLIFDSDRAFLAADGPISDFVIAGIFAISLLIGKPLLGMAIREVFPRVRRGLPPHHRVLFYVTAIFVAENLVMGVIRLWLLDQVSPSYYPLISRGIGIPLRLLLVWWSFRLVQDEMKRRLAAGLWVDEPRPESALLAAGRREREELRERLGLPPRPESQEHQERADGPEPQERQAK